MEQIRNQLKNQPLNIFDDDNEDNYCAKVTTEIFDKTLPSQLQFDEDNVHHQKDQNQETKEFTMFDNKDHHVQLKTNVLPQIENQEKGGEKSQPSQYEILTKCIANFTFKKTSNSLILRQSDHQIGSYIPFFLKIKTFLVKFNDQLSQLTKGVSSIKLFWKNVVGYAKVQLYINNGFIYLLQRRKQGFYVQSIWDLQNLFKLFSDKQQQKLRLVFRIKDNEQTKLITKELQEVDLNLIACIFDEAKSLEITCGM